MPYTGQTVDLRWDDSVYGPQTAYNTDNTPPVSDNYFYANCGTQRSYPLENINYDLEKVIIPLLQIISDATSTGGVALTDTSHSYTVTDTFTSIASGACKYVTLFLLSTATASVELQINGGATIYLEPGYSIVVNVSDLANIEARQSPATDILYFVQTAVA